MPGPTKPDGQTTFVLAFGFFDADGTQAVHIKADGTEVPIIIPSYPIDTDEKPERGIKLLH